MKCLHFSEVKENKKNIVQNYVFEIRQNQKYMVFQLQYREKKPFSLEELWGEKLEFHAVSSCSYFVSMITSLSPILSIFGSSAEDLFSKYLFCPYKVWATAHDKGQV